MREIGHSESDAILGAMRQVALAGGHAITYADTTSVLAAGRYLLRRRDRRPRRQHGAALRPARQARARAGSHEVPRHHGAG